uniref:DEP domain-containing protein n=1 Tax=Timspurckia oligopyrenoides TaxID=708627 RepID=A0A7S0ZGR4_9RHOD|mmetsp:Transcript_4656/g.8126  ORF Transcript_4656/g.8126 Transcript_4656/m.8126 type:complete len:123 (+) Transcript_4656:148-516(+)
MKLFKVSLGARLLGDTQSNGSSLSDIEVDPEIKFGDFQYEQVIGHLKKTVKKRNRTVGDQDYSNTVLGYELTSWLIQKKFCDSLQEAEFLCSEFMSRHLIHRVGDDCSTDFRCNLVPYQFNH